MTAAVHDLKGFAFEVVAAKVAWDIVKFELPPVMKLNEEALLKKLGFKYNNEGENGGLVQRLVRTPREDSTTTGAPANPTPTPTTPSPTAPGNAAPRQPSNSRTTTPAPAPNPTAGRRVTPTTPTTGEARTAAANARTVDGAASRLTTTTARLGRTMDETQ